MMKNQGRLIVFEGPSGVGKTTLSRDLYQYFIDKSIPCKLMSFPGHELGTLGHHIYSLHQEPTNFGVKKIHPLSLQLLHIAAHIDAIETCILPQLFSGKTVILDRFWWSTLVYGKVNKVNQLALNAAIKVEHICWNEIKPTQVFLITRDKSIHNEEESKQWDSLCYEYENLADKEKGKYPVNILSNNGYLELTIKDMLNIVEKSYFNNPEN